MYRFIKIRNISLQNSYKTSNMKYLPKICVFCNFYHRCTPRSLTIEQLRHHSSNTNSIMLISKEKLKLKRKLKKYAELLEVTNSTTNSRKAAVKNLNADQLSILVDQPDITLDKLHKIENKSFMNQNKVNFISNFTSNVNSSEKSSFNQDLKNSIDKLSSLSNIYSKQSHENILDPREEIDTHMTDDELELSHDLHKSEFINNLRINNNVNDFNIKEIINLNRKPIRSEKKGCLRENDLKNVKYNLKTIQLSINKEKLKQFNKLMLAYTNVCINCNDSRIIDKIISLYKKWTQKNILYINNIHVFNIIIEKLSFNSDFKRILEILEYVRKNDIHLNAQTYAYIFNCIGRMKRKDKDKLDILKVIKSDMFYDGISLNDVIIKSIFVQDQKEYVENVIKLIDNTFQPIYNIPDIEYDCRLLNNLTTESANPRTTVDGLLSIDSLKKRLKKQIEMEIDGQVIVYSIAKQTTSMQNINNWRNKLLNLEKIWESLAIDAFKRNLVSLKNIELVKKGTKIALHPFLCILKPEDYIRIMMRKVRLLGMGSEMHSLPYNALCHQLGIQVYKMYETKIKQKCGVNDKTVEVYMQYCDWFISRNDKLNFREKWTSIEHELNKHGVSLGFEIPQWQYNILVSIGTFIFNIILNDLKLDVNLIKNKGHGEHYIPAFFRIFRHKGMKLKEEVKPHPIIAKLYRDSHPTNLTFDTTLVPTLCPPRPWISVHKGGYIVTKTDIVRVAQSGNQQWDRLINATPKKLYPSLDSLNQLGSIPWTINSVILDIAIKVFQNDGSVELNVPQPPSVLKPITPATKYSTPEEKKKINKSRLEYKAKKSEMYSLWCETLYRLSLANHFRNEIFWLPHNMDFRGRVYPVPPHLHHLGSDLARSILMFALKKPLGPKGLSWLKLHAINLTGFKKTEPISNRLKYADEIMDEILDSAENPLTGKMWWSTSENPWQTLAVCTEIAAALKSPNPEEFMSGFPIHQDGSCNGLQHYAALGRDQIGAESVNLNPSDSPQDVYSSVAKMIEQKRKEDAANGVIIAKVLEGFIQRKVIKQTVMTTVYGVTWFGAKLQILRQLEALQGFPQEYLWLASIYLVQKTFEILRTMFKSAREIQDWFTEACGLICSLHEENMEWVTPLGLPIMQPYSKAIRPSKNSKSFIVYTSDIYRKPNLLKQKNAFPPNFVHSLDSCHMMLTSINCERAGITFVSVHDCFWTHPSSVEIMNKICREQFVLLHSEPILQDLSEFLVHTFVYNNDSTNKRLDKSSSNEKLKNVLTKVPKQGDFDLQSVLKSTYFFS